MQMMTRHLHYAGSWYEADPILLEQQLEEFFSRGVVEKNISRQSRFAP